MNHSPETNTPKPVSELYHYADDSVAEVFKGDGDRFSMKDLARRVGEDPVAMDAGCVYVQTVELTNDNGAPQRRRYYFDGTAMSDPQSHKATFLETVPLDDPAHDIVIGQTWQSPIGVTQGKVEVISLPWVKGYDPTKVQERDQKSPMPEGRRILDLVASQHPNAQPRTVNPAVAHALTVMGGGLGKFVDRK